MKLGLEMASIQGPVVCPVVHAKQTVDSPLLKPILIRTGFKGLNINSNVSYRRNSKNFRPIRCTFSSSSDGNGSMAENSSHKNADYVNSSVVEAGNLLSILVFRFLSFLLVAGGLLHYSTFHHIYEYESFFMSTVCTHGLFYVTNNPYSREKLPIIVRV